MILAQENSQQICHSHQHQRTFLVDVHIYLPVKILCYDDYRISIDIHCADDDAQFRLLIRNTLNRAIGLNRVIDRNQR